LAYQDVGGVWRDKRACPAVITQVWAT